jgi:hypothetical protein
LPTEQRPPDAEAVALARAIGVTLLQTVAEQAPAGWQILLLSPPPHQDRMTWHVHLAPSIRLELADGRAVAAQGPSGGHEWALPSGRRATVATGDPAPAPNPTTTAVRVAGPYVSVSLGGAQVSLRCLDGRGRPHELRAPHRDLERLRSAARQAVDLAVASKMSGGGSTLAYSTASWAAHGRSWVTVTGR